MISSGAPYEVVADRIPRLHAGALRGRRDHDAARRGVGGLPARHDARARCDDAPRRADRRGGGRAPAADDDPLALHAWTVTLRACSALDAYRRTSVAVPHGPAVVHAAAAVGHLPALGPVRAPRGAVGRAVRRARRSARPVARASMLIAPLDHGRRRDPRAGRPAARRLRADPRGGHRRMAGRMGDRRERLHPEDRAPHLVRYEREVRNSKNEVRMTPTANAVADDPGRRADRRPGAFPSRRVPRLLRHDRRVVRGDGAARPPRRRRVGRRGAEPRPLRAVPSGRRRARRWNICRHRR